MSDTGEWTEFLGGKTDYVRIRRRVSLQDKTKVGAEMFLSSQAVPGLEAMDPQELDMVNIRPFLEEQFGMAAADASHLVQTARLDETSARAFGLPCGLDVLEIHARARTLERAPVYFQRILVSTERCSLLI